MSNYRCQFCNKKKGKNAFSNNQLNKPKSERKCKKCINVEQKKRNNNDKMNDTSSPKASNEKNNNEITDILFDGYLRETESMIGTKFPIEVKQLIECFKSKLKILAIGANNCGQLGLGFNDDTMYQLMPFNESGLSIWTRMKNIEHIAPHQSNIFYNFNSIFIIDVKHNVFAAGMNGTQHLGPYPLMVHQFMRIKTDESIGMVSSGVFNNRISFLQTINGQLFASSSNLSESVVPRFVENNDEMINEIKCGVSHCAFLTNFGNVYIADFDDNDDEDEQYLMPKLLDIDRKIKQIAVGSSNTVLLDADGEIDIIEGNWGKQVVIDMLKSIKVEITKIASGWNHVLCLDVNGKVICFGHNGLGQLGNIPTNDDRMCYPQTLPIFDNDEDCIIDIDCGATHSLMLSKNYQVITFGTNEKHQCSAVINERMVVDPYIIDQKQEMRIEHNEYVYAIKAGTFESMVFIQSKKHSQLF